jgi:hypothetical protein
MRDDTTLGPWLRRFLLVVLCHFQLLDGAVQALRPECTLSGVRRFLQVSR